jgi:glycosyltransferase involved in cell wall biosynthesis
MKIAYISADPGVPVFGRKGNSVHVQEVIRAMLKRGASIHLFTTRTGGEIPEGFENVIVHKLPSLPKGDLATREAAALEVNGVLSEALEQFGPFDMVYERYSLWSVAGIQHANAHEIPGMLEVNAPLIDEQLAYRGLINHALAEEIAGTVFNLATAVLAVSEGVAGYARRYTLYPYRVHVVPNGINPERFPPDVEPSLPATAGIFTVGFVGTLKPWHGLPTLIEAFDRLHERDPRTRLLIVGDGSERERLERDVSDRELTEAVAFTGSVDPNEIPGLLASMDVATAPYPDDPEFYFSPLKVYEYMAAGVPCVASRIGQIETVIEHGVTGFLCRPGDPDDLAETLCGVRNQDRLRASVGARARSTAITQHTWQSAVERVFDLAVNRASAEKVR